MTELTRPTRAGASSSTPTVTVTVTAAPAAGSTGDGQGSGLDSKTLGIGLGVGLPAAFAIVAALVFFGCQMRKQRKAGKGDQPEQMTPVSPAPEKPPVQSPVSEYFQPQPSPGLQQQGYPVPVSPFQQQHHSPSYASSVPSAHPYNYSPQMHQVPPTTHMAAGHGPQPHMPAGAEYPSRVHGYQEVHELQQ